MKNKVIATAYFSSRFKKFRKKFPSLPKEIEELEQILIVNPECGESLGSDIYKIRLASKSKGVGKSGGFRIITYLINKKADGVEIYLITLYDKSEESTIKKEEIIQLIKRLL